MRKILMAGALSFAFTLMTGPTTAHADADTDEIDRFHASSGGTEPQTGSRVSGSVAKSWGVNYKLPQRWHVFSEKNPGGEKGYFGLEIRDADGTTHVTVLVFNVEREVRLNGSFSAVIGTVHRNTLNNYVAKDSDGKPVHYTEKPEKTISVSLENGNVISVKVATISFLAKYRSVAYTSYTTKTGNGVYVFIHNGLFYESLESGVAEVFSFIHFG